MRYKYIITLGLLMPVFSLILYVVNYLLFKDAHHLLTAFGEHMAFMPIYVFITAVVAEQLLWRSQRNEISRRTNALVGTFFSEIGFDLIKILTKYDSNFAALKAKVQLDDGDAALFKTIHKLSESYVYGAPKGTEDILEIGELLMAKKEFMIILMSNASLIEKDEFSELLLAANHIHEALNTGGDVSNISEDFIDHLHKDLEKVYKCLIGVWAGYLAFISKEDPYLYKLAIEQSNRIRSGSYVSNSI